MGNELSKQLTNRHIGTVTRELNKAVHGIVDAWRLSDPYPTWEEDQEWRRQNPSPREKHARAETEVRAHFEKEANDLLIRIKLGEIPVASIYHELSKVLDGFGEARKRYHQMYGDQE